MSLGPMSHVEFKKCPCRPVDFRGQGHCKPSGSLSTDYSTWEAQPGRVYGKMHPVNPEPGYKRHPVEQTTFLHWEGSREHCWHFFPLPWASSCSLCTSRHSTRTNIMHPQMFTFIVNKSSFIIKLQLNRTLAQLCSMADIV